tara:strand:- start:1438 stop:1764 length:327 start_codon:yes stop_codon:yes gene_type:complete
MNWNTFDKDPIKSNFNYKIYINRKIKIIKYDNCHEIGYLINFSKSYDSVTFSIKSNFNDIHVHSITHNLITKIEILDENLKALKNYRLTLKNKILNYDLSNFIESFYL